MLKSRVYSKCETWEYNDHGFDLQEDFSHVFNTLLSTYLHTSFGSLLY